MLSSPADRPILLSAFRVDLHMVLRIGHLPVQVAFAGLDPALSPLAQPSPCVHLRTRSIPPRPIPRPSSAIVQGLGTMGRDGIALAYGAVERHAGCAGHPQDSSTPRQHHRLSSHPAKEKGVITARERADFGQPRVAIGGGREREISPAHACAVGTMPSAHRRWLKHLCPDHSMIVWHARPSLCASRGWRRGLTGAPRPGGKIAMGREYVAITWSEMTTALLTIDIIIFLLLA
jgi:hypothetical protein